MMYPREVSKISGLCSIWMWLIALQSIGNHFRYKHRVIQGDSIGHCEKNVHINMCLILNGYPDRAKDHISNQ